MKKILLILVLILTRVSLFSQDEHMVKPSGSEQEIKTLFKKSVHPIKLGYTIGLDGVYTQFDGKHVFLGGLSVGAIVDHFFSVGLAGYAILNSHNLGYTLPYSNSIVPEDVTDAYLYGGYGGLKMEFRIFPSSPVHVNFPILIGGGYLVYNTWTYHHQHPNDYHNDGITIDSDGFFVVEPGAMVELNLIKNLRIDAGVTYRYTPDLDLVCTKTNLINSFNAVFSLKFGKF